MMVVMMMAADRLRQILDVGELAALGGVVEVGGKLGELGGRRGIAGRRGGLRGGPFGAATPGNSTGPSTQPTGPRKQDIVERQASGIVNSRPSTTVAIIGETAAQPIEPMA